MQLIALRRAFDRLPRFPSDRRGTSLLEFALGLPIFLTIGAYGTEIANYALTQLRVSQYALQIADNASRLGVNSGLAIFQLREGDLNDVFQGLRLYSKNTNLTQYGRVTLSSLEDIQQTYDNAPVQRIHWQRCIGLRSGAGYDSTYGTAPTSAGTDGTAATKGTAQPLGMGDTGAKVNAPQGYGVMFVEVNYEYQPLFGNLFYGNSFFTTSPKIHYTASLIVRDTHRDYQQVYNPSPTQTKMTCDRHTT